MKPKVSIDIDPGAFSVLDAYQILPLLPEGRCHHYSKGLRLPLGIYNVSVNRVMIRVIRLCGRIEEYFKAGGAGIGAGANDEHLSDLVDCMELALYAAAEHVDDVDSIAVGMFRDRRECERNPGYKILQREVKSLKRFLSGVANTIKHNQARIRIFSVEMAHGGVDGYLHGYFIESVKNGVVGPSKVLNEDQDCFSVTSLAWQIIHFVYGMSQSLHKFLGSLIPPLAGTAKEIEGKFVKAVIAAARVPLYTFGEEHPFVRLAVNIYSSSGYVSALKSGVYGSIAWRWDRVAIAEIGRFYASWEGDGITKSFQIPRPKQVALSYWQ